MAERQLSDVPDILEENLFDSGISIQLSMSGRFRDIASLLVRNAISKSIIHAEDRDPADSDQVSGLTQFWVNTDTNARFVSDAGGDWEELGGITLTGSEIVGLLAALTGDDRLSYDSLKDKPTIPAELTGAAIVSLLAALTGDDRLSYDSLKDKPTIPAELTGAGVVSLLAALTGNARLAASAIRDLPEGGGLTSVATDETIQGDGTAESPLSVVDDDPSGEIGKILSIGSYAFGSSASPASGNAGWSASTLHVHTTSSSGDVSATLGGLKQGDYLYIGSEAILEITAAPTSASSIYTFTVTAIQGTVPTSESHTIYYITEERALIAGAVHSFNIANGAVTLAKLAAEVLTNWLTAVATDATLTGDGTTGSPLSVAAPSDNSPPDVDVSMYQTFGSWAWTSTSAPATGQFYVESGELKIFETDSDSTDKRTALDDVAVGDRFQFGELNAFEVTAVGVRSGNGIWTFTGSWAEVFDVGDFDGSYSVHYIKKANVLARNNVVPDRFLKLNSSLLVEANDPEESIEPLWEGSLGSDDVDTATNLDTGKKFSDYTHIIVNYSGSNKRNLWTVPRKLWDQLGFIEVSNKDNHLTVRMINDTSFEVGVATGGILLRKLHGYKGV